MVGVSPTSQSAFTDAQGQNNIDRNSRQWKDLDLFFQMKPEGKDVNKVTDVQAVKRSVRNLVLMNHYEKPFHPEIGSGIREMLFENMTMLTAVILGKKVEDVIENFEPRARVENVECVPLMDRNKYNVIVYFYVENMPAELQEFSTLLEQVQ